MCWRVVQVRAAQVVGGAPQEGVGHIETTWAVDATDHGTKRGGATWSAASVRGDFGSWTNSVKGRPLMPIQRCDTVRYDA